MDDDGEREESPLFVGNHLYSGMDSAFDLLAVDRIDRAQHLMYSILLSLCRDHALCIELVTHAMRCGSCRAPQINYIKPFIALPVSQIL